MTACKPRSERPTTRDPPLASWTIVLIYKGRLAENIFPIFGFTYIYFAQLIIRPATNVILLKKKMPKNFLFENKT